MIVFQTTVKLCNQIDIISSSQKAAQKKASQYKKIWPKLRKTNYALVIKLGLTFLALFSIFLKFSVVFLTAEED